MRDVAMSPTLDYVLRTRYNLHHKQDTWLRFDAGHLNETHLLAPTILVETLS